jgi:hypothetical protein
MTRYRLPDDLGGSEVNEHEIDPALTVDGRRGRIVRTDAGTVLAVAEDHLTLVPPPLPPEPEFGAVLRCDDGYLHIRKGRSWNDHGDGYCTWAELNTAHDRPLVRLVPDPFAEPVELPWRLTFDDDEPILVSHSTASNRVAYVSGWGHLTADDCRAMARALWTIADEEDAP